MTLVHAQIEFDDDAFPKGIPSRLIREKMSAAVREMTVPIFEQHMEDGQSFWEENDPEYDRRKGTGEKFNKSGQAKHAMSQVKHRFKKLIYRTDPSDRQPIFKMAFRNIKYLDRERTAKKYRKMKRYKTTKFDGVDVYWLTQYKKEFYISMNYDYDDEIAKPFIEGAIRDIFRELELLD